MIIKSMSRKAPTFGQLASYIDKGASRSNSLAFAHNLYHDSPSAKRAAEIFADNYRYLPKRKNGNALLHEVLVLEPQTHLARHEQIQALETLARAYCEIRAPHQLAWGKVHLDTDYPHIHLMLSANEVRSNKRVRLTKAEFAKAQRELEAFKTRELPQLKDRTVYAEKGYSDKQQTEPTKIKTSEGEMVRRTGEPSAKQKVKVELAKILAAAVGQNQIDQQLKQAGFELYKRGQTFGVFEQSSGKKYRLSTLGLTQAFEEARQREAVKWEPLPQAVPRSKIEPEVVAKFCTIV